MVVINEIIEKSVSSLQGIGHNPVRMGMHFSFGDYNTCKKLFTETFIHCDKTMKQFEFIPEYEQIIDWMMDNKGQGLFLTGDCGRGKSNIIQSVIPVLIHMTTAKIIKTYHAEDIPERIHQMVNLKMIAIDELGTEPLCNDFGEKYEGFNKIINKAEMYIRFLMISTNLNSKQILDRYGERALERIGRLCKVIKFQGNSLR